MWFSFARLNYSKPHAKDKALWNVIKSIKVIKSDK